MFEACSGGCDYERNILCCLASMLLWTEVDQFGQGSLMSAPTGTSKSSVVLGNHQTASGQRKKRSLYGTCSCSDMINVSPIITMDYTKQGQNEVIFVDVGTNTIFAADINGCNCTAVFKPSAGDSHGERFANKYVKTCFY